MPKGPRNKGNKRGCRFSFYKEFISLLINFTICKQLYFKLQFYYYLAMFLSNDQKNCGNGLAKAGMAGHGNEVTELFVRVKVAFTAEFLSTNM